MQSRLHRPSPPMIVALTALLIAIGGTAVVAFGAIPGPDGRIAACYQTSANVLDRIVVLAEPDEACPQSYARITWNQTGPPGPPGSQGPQGPAGASGSSTAPEWTVIQRRIVLRRDVAAVAKCPRTYRAVGGGAVLNDPDHLPLNSYPYVERQMAVGWAFRTYEERKWVSHPAVRASTNEAGFPVHSHRYTTQASVVPKDYKGFTRDPADVTVYVICAGTLTVVGPIPRP